MAAPGQPPAVASPKAVDSAAIAIPTATSPHTVTASPAGSRPPQQLTETVGLDAKHADKDSASAYAVTALANAAHDGRPSADAAPAATASPVDWQRVADQAEGQGLPEARAGTRPAGSVARLRAMFEQQRSEPALQMSFCTMPHKVSGEW